MFNIVAFNIYFIREYFPASIDFYVIFRFLWNTPAMIQTAITQKSPTRQSANKLRFARYMMGFQKNIVCQIP